VMDTTGTIQPTDDASQPACQLGLLTKFHLHCPIITRTNQSRYPRAMGVKGLGRGQVTRKKLPIMQFLT